MTISFYPSYILVVISCQTGIRIVVYVSIIRALSTWKSQDRQYNGRKRDKDTNTNRQKYAQKTNDSVT